MKCSFHIILLGDAPSIGVLCSVYKARCSRSSGLGKKQVSLRHKRARATQQDLDSHILLCRTNGVDYVPHSSSHTLGQIISPVHQVTILHLANHVTPWPSWLRRATVNRKIVSSILTGVVFFLSSYLFVECARCCRNWRNTFRPLLNVLLSRHLTVLFPTSIHVIMHQLRFNVGIFN